MLDDGCEANAAAIDSQGGGTIIVNNSLVFPSGNQQLPTPVSIAAVQLESDDVIILLILQWTNKQKNEFQRFNFLNLMGSVSGHPAVFS